MAYSSLQLTAALQREKDLETKLKEAEQKAQGLSKSMKMRREELADVEAQVDKLSSQSQYKRNLGYSLFKQDH
jgi:hypothetical protein